MLGTGIGITSQSLRRDHFAVASLSHAAMSTATITEGATADGSDLTITWADGHTETIASGGGSSRSYSGATAGNVVITATSAITTIDLRGAGELWDFALTALPSGLTFFMCQGSNTVTGDIANLPSGLTYFQCYGSNTVTGDIANLPSGLTYFRCIGSNTISGDIADLPSGLTYFLCYGSNTISGDIANLPSGLTDFRCYGSNTVTTTSGASLPQSSLRYMRIEGSGLTATEVDDILIACAGVSTWTNEKVVSLAGANAGRTSASDSAVSTLTGYGVTVTTN